MQVLVSGAENLANGLSTVLEQVPKLQPREVGQVILQAARTRVPVRSGNLRASGSSQGMTVRYSAPYAAPIHWGWKKRHIQPNPWLVKGTEASAQEWCDAFAEALQEEIDRKI